MSKWKCDICGKEFENFHAQGFDSKIYCPLCFFKKEYKRLKEEKELLRTQIATKDIVFYKCRDERDKYKEVIEEVREYVENNAPITHYSFNGILEILDKAKENK